MRLRQYVCTAALVLASIGTWAGLAPVPAHAQAPPSGDASLIPEEVVATAPVVLDGNTLFSVRGTTSFPAAERAAAIAARLVAIASDRSLAPESIRVEDVEMASRIAAGRQLIINVYDADGAVENLSRQVLATLLLPRIREAVTDYRTARSAPVLRAAAQRAAAAVVVGIALAIAVVWLWRRFDRALESRYRKRVEQLTARSHEVVTATGVWTTVRKVMRLLRSVAIAALGFFVLEYALAQFPQTRAVALSLSEWMVGPLVTMWASFATTIPDLIFLAILFLVVRFVLTVIRRFFDALEDGRAAIGSFEREWATPTYKLVRLAVVAFAIVVGYPYIPGSSSEAFKGVSIFVGIVFSLGSSSFLSNMIAGYSLNYRRLYKVGDRVKIGDVSGEVSAVRLQVTHVRTVRNEEVTIPNSVILNTHVINYSALASSNGLILSTTVGIGYETPWRQVEAMLIEAARRTPGVKQSPAPHVRQQALADYAVTYALLAHTDEPRNMEVTYTDLHRNILDVFNEHGVQIMTPSYVADPEIPKLVPREQWYAAPAEAPQAGSPAARADGT